MGCGGARNHPAGVGCGECLDGISPAAARAVEAIRRANEPDPSWNVDVEVGKAIDALKTELATEREAREEAERRLYDAHEALRLVRPVVVGDGDVARFEREYPHHYEMYMADDDSWADYVIAAEKVMDTVLPAPPEPNDG